MKIELEVLNIIRLFLSWRKETANLFVSDSEGLNRFKSGFFVDNFSGFQTQDDSFDINNSIDIKYNELRPKHYTNSVDMILGPVVDRDPNADSSVAAIEGNNVRKGDDVLTLDYAEVEYITQAFATRTESVTPFLISFWNGTMELTPSTDSWVDTTRLEAKTILQEGDYNETFDALVANGEVDPQTGFGPILWDSWETNWGGITDETLLGEELLIMVLILFTPRALVVELDNGEEEEL